MIEILCINPDDTIAKRAIFDVLNLHHDGRIKQTTLDFWRLYNYPGNSIFLVASEDNKLCAISCVAINDTKSMHSITVVANHYRKTGIGKSILSKKLAILNKFYPEVSFRTFVAISNEASTMTCISSGLVIIGTKSRTRLDGKETKYYVLS